MVLGGRILERMEMLKLSQAELARRVGMKQPSIFNLIHRSKKGSTKLHLIARELETTPAYLMGETDDPYADAPAPVRLDSEERQLLDAFRRLKDMDRRSCLYIVKELSDRIPKTVLLHDEARPYEPEGRRG